MSGLLLKLAPNERFLINGAVVENGSRRTSIFIRTPNTSILRLKDAIHPENNNTPVLRLCYTCQLIIVGDIAIDEGHRQVALRLEELSQVFTDRDSRITLTEATAALLEGNYYRVLKLLKALLPRERRLMEIAK